MKTPLAFLAALALVAASGCFGLPEGSADVGDQVVVRYTAIDAATGATLRANQTASFTLGTGGSGLGIPFERELRGAMQGETVEVALDEDAATQIVEVSRALPSIPAVQSANRTAFDRSTAGPAVLGKTFPYSIYTVRVTGVTNTTVDMEIDVPANMVTPYPLLGVNLRSERVGDEVVRTIDPINGTRINIEPPTSPTAGTPFGLNPGQYIVLGATATEMQLATSPDFLGKDVRVRATLVRVTSTGGAGEPVDRDGDTNYGVRTSPQVLGDPATLDFTSAPADDAGHGDDHAH